MDFPATAGAFDTVFNGDTPIFWGDAFVTKMRRQRDGVDAPAAAGDAGGAGAACARPTATSAAADHVRLERRLGRGARTRFRSTSRARSPRRWCATEIVTHSIYATSGLATATHFWRVRGVNIGGRGRRRGPRCGASRRRQPPPPAGLGSLDINPSTVVGGNASSGTVVLSTGAPEGGAVDRAVEQQPGRGERAGHGHGAGQQLHRRVHDRDVTGAASTTRDDHRELQRRDAERRR